MNFWKMNGAGNDFIMLDNIASPLPTTDYPALARLLCERHLSIGADGLMVIDHPTEGGDYKMRFYNSDGSIGEMCGNGARCICRYGYETALAGQTQRVETTAGMITGHRIDARNYCIQLNSVTTMELDFPMDVDGTTYQACYIELGNPGLPHVAVEVPNLKDQDENWLRELGRKLRWHQSLRKGANVNFYEILAPDHLYERTFERGVEDFTYACGTGTGSVVSALTLQGKVSGNHVTVDMVGGRLFIDAPMVDGTLTQLHLTGPTNIVAKGQVTDEDLCLAK
ncbi:diaminopimelate epimerase [Bengtsoniella intestinalis]|uniref:diaminopimelate epimerase n=1 Tax=Bengtsoniella intestinalis TaxID=3073143 RepID=UPI00391F8BF9